MKIAGIDVHKKVLMVVVMDSSAPEEKPARRRFVTLPSELQRFRIWLQEQGVEEAVVKPPQLVVGSLRHTALRFALTIR